jgi:hypothetical protein
MPVIGYSRACCQGNRQLEGRARGVVLDTFKSSVKQNQRTFVLLVKVLRAPDLAFDLTSRKLEDAFTNVYRRGTYHKIWFGIITLRLKYTEQAFFELSHQYANFCVVRFEIIIRQVAPSISSNGLKITPTAC